MRPCISIAAATALAAWSLRTMGVPKIGHLTQVMVQYGNKHLGVDAAAQGCKAPQIAHQDRNLRLLAPNGKPVRCFQQLVDQII